MATKNKAAALLLCFLFLGDTDGEGNSPDPRRAEETSGTSRVG
jgi:hypothetical protein